MNRVLFGLVIVAVLFAGCTDGPGDNDMPNGENSSLDNTDDTDNRGSNDDVDDNTDDGENVVTYSSSGFSPQTIWIQQGETVTWRSEGPEMWVASDSHPTHTEYDGTSRSQHCNNGGDAFDQCGTGQEYSFTFDQPGEWGYHDHEHPGNTGTVIVE